VVRRAIAVHARGRVAERWQDISVTRRMGTAWRSASATHVTRAKVPGGSDVASRGGEKRGRPIENIVACIGGSGSGIQRRQIEIAHMIG
jgi:hypothetical protein